MGRFVDPFFCIILGFAVLAESTALGCWLIIAGTAVRIFEDAVHRKELNRDLDILDSLIISEVHGGTVEKFDDSAPHSSQSSSPPVPTGLAPDVMRSFKKR